MDNKIYCYVPDVCLDAESEVSMSRQVRVALDKAIELKLTPLVIPPVAGGITSRTVQLEEGQIAYLRQFAQEDTAPGRVVGGLLYSLYVHNAGGGRKSRQPAGAQSALPQCHGLRNDQTQLVREAYPLLLAGKIVLAEAGTGSGKSRIIAHLARSIADASRHWNWFSPPDLNASPETTPQFIMERLEQAQAVRRQRLEKAQADQGKKIIISAPSIENVCHLVSEWRTVENDFPGSSPLKVAVVLGLGQFVSPSVLEIILSEREDELTPANSDEAQEELEAIAAIRQWVSEGMPAGIAAATSHLEKICLSVGVRLCGLMDDLMAMLAVTGIRNIDEAALNKYSGQEERRVYEALRERAFDKADVIFTTHAMLCLDNLFLASEKHPGLLPPAAAVFCDEAHTLEAVQASMLSRSMSFQRLSMVLNDPVWESLPGKTRRKTLLGNARDVAEKLEKTLRRLEGVAQLPVVQEDGDRNFYWIWQEAKSSIRTLIETLEKTVGGNLEVTETSVSGNMRGKGVVPYIEQCLDALKYLEEGRQGALASSPVRRRISFTIGPNSVSRQLAQRWAVTPCAALLSGTLLHYGASGAIGTSTAAEFAIPMNRIDITTPLQPPWLLTTPTVMQPAPEVFHRLVPPGQYAEDEEGNLEMAAWIYALGQTMKVIADPAVGGTLVLMTGYRRLDLLWDAILRHHPDLGPRLMRSRRRTRISTLKENFVAMSRHGKRPIWLATGAAWTGLDLRDTSLPDDRASEDNILTDVVIPALPFGSDQSTTHTARKGRAGFVVEVVKTQRQFRQGVGRLIRRAGLKDRRIWILDGRLQSPASSRYTADIKRILAMYPKHDSFRID